MRPASEIRHALLKAAHDLKAIGQPCTLRELASHAQVGTEAARRTVDNMRRAGQLVISGHCRMQHRNRPVALYAPAQETAAGFVDLAKVMNIWAN